MIKRLAVNTSTNFLFQALTTSLRLVSVPVIVAATSSEAYGIIVLASAVMGYFDLMKSGVPAGTVKFVAEYNAKGKSRVVSKVVNTSLCFYLFVGLLMASGVWAFVEVGGLSIFQISPENKTEARNILQIVAGFAILKWPALTFGQALDGLQRYAENNLCKAAGNLLSISGAIGTALAGAPIEVIFALQNLDFVFNTPLQYYWLRHLQPDIRLTLEDATWYTLKMIVGYSVWMLLNRVARLFIYQTDRIILGIFLPVSSLTVYKVVVTPFRYIKKISSLFNSAVLPLVSSVDAESGRSGLDRFIYLLSRYANALVAPLSILGVYFSKPFIRLWMGSEYVEYAWIAQVACGAQMLWQANSALGQVFYGSGKVKEVSLIAFSVAVANVPLGIWWVQEIGVAGVVFSTVTASILTVPLQYTFAFPRLEISRMSYTRTIVRGQWAAWLLGILLIPLWGPLQSIESWIKLGIWGGGLGLLFTMVTLASAIEKRHRDGMWRFIYQRVKY